MNRARLLWLASPWLLAIASCQLVAKLDSRGADPLATECKLPQVGAGRIRVVNLVAATQAVDFCVRTTDEAWSRPVLRDGGLDCPNGYKYEDMSAPFAVQAGNIDVRTIPAGETCAAPALSEADGVPVGTDAVVTLVRFGGNGVPESLVSFPEATAVDAVTMKVRFVNALPGSSALYMGFATDASLPTTVAGRLLATAVGFGSAPRSTDAKPLSGVLDEHGYLVIAPNEYEMGVAADGTAKAILVATIPNKSAAFTLFAVGNPNDLAFPTRGLLCDESNVNGITTPCTESALPTLSVDTFNVGLYGANAPDEAGRRPYLQKAIAGRDSDVMCILEAGRKSDRDAIAAIAAQQGSFANSYQGVGTDLSTPATDATDQNGALPPPPASPACGGSVSQTQVDDAFTCMVAKCNTSPGNPGGVLNGSTNCLSTQCVNKLAYLFGGTTDQQRCFDCIVDNVTSGQSYEQSKLTCTTDARAPLAFGGETPSMILSRYPLTKTDTFVLPSTNFRRVVLHAQLALQEGSSVDFYCAQLSSPLLDSDLPYVGDYSAGDAMHGYDNEQLLQAKRLIAWVQKTSGNRPAIIAGDWHSSVASVQAGAKVIDDVAPATLGALRSAFALAAAPGWVPQCTYCPANVNPFNGGFTVGYAFNDTYLFNWPDKATTDESVIFNQSVVPAGSGNEMLSPSFGQNIRVIRP